MNGARHGLILRRDPPTHGQGRAPTARHALDRATEFRVLRGGLQGRRARARGAVRARAGRTGWARPTSCAGSAARRSPASSCAIRPTPTARGKIAGQLGEILARIHAIDLRACRRSPIARPPTTSRACAARSTRWATPQPVFELALSWLDRRKPAPIARPVLVHGDYRTGNYLADETRRDGDPRLGRRASRRPRRGSRLAVRQELALRLGRQAGRRLRQPRGAVVGLRARRRRQGRSGARALVGSVRHGALGHHLPSPRRGGISRAR